MQGASRIKQITVTGLFGLFSHPIPLNLGERLTIIHGANGLGKTIVLRMIAGLFQGHFSIFRRVPFENLRIDFEDGRTLDVTTRPVPDERGQLPLPMEEGPRHVVLTLTVEGKTETYSPGSHRFPRRSILADRIGSLLPNLTRVRPETWRDDRTGELLDLEDLVERYHDDLPLPSLDVPDEPPGIRELRRSLSVRLIRTQRLDADEEPKRPEQVRRGVAQVVPAVERNSIALTHHIRGVLEEYASVSQRLDRSFPLRLFQQSASAKMSGPELRQRFLRLEARREELHALGFLDLDTTFSEVPDSVLDERRDVFSIYVSDVEQKLAVFDDVARRAGELIRIITERFKYKKLEISRDRGYVLRSDNGKELKPSDLSSGEQHELVLIHELIFNTQKHSLILIDEPELSLHLEWQERFLDDLRKISDLSGFDVVIATHSADIIGSNWDLTVELRGPLSSAS
jgi:energy-coupling factor transporter ATP-binding protein EcfA2